MPPDALDQQMQHYSLIQHADPKASSYKMAMEDVTPFLTPEMQTKLEQQKAPAPPATQPHADAIQQFRTTMQNANLTTPDNTALPGTTVASGTKTPPSRTA
jgi:hypothetical protein